jgi:Arf-GAP/SH3 domain/ANK repeat/PH domain-containing protein
MASVREARNSDRRFCFEVVTPHYKRVYQATSEEDMKNWISSINNAVKSTIEGGGSVKSFDISPNDSGLEPSQLKNIQSALTGKSPNYHHSVHGSNPMSVSNYSSSSVYRRTTVGGKPTTNVRRNSNNFRDDPEKLLQMIREADPSNTGCADCGSQIKTEWVSINLGIVLCIECSGLHRSLGTHISKVRSLTLDVTSFTPDLVDLLCQVGNRISNSIWEAKIGSAHRPNAQSSRETRLKFITSKYSQRAFVAPLSSTLSVFTSADEMLVESTKKNDLLGALYALALRANPNLVDPETNTHLISLSLATVDPLLDSSQSDLTQQSTPTPAVTFPLAELLLQNCGEIPIGMSTSMMAQSAKNYVAHKTAKRINQEASPQASPRPGAPLSLKERQQREKERLQKRISSGARLHRTSLIER